MATSTKHQSDDVVEMSWDPITRIVGSLGIYATIDFKAKEVRECHSTSSIFRGYSLFMKGKDPRDAHFITSRICGICGDNHATCSVYNQNMAYGIAPPHLGRVDHQPRRGRGVHVRPQHLPGEPGRGGLLRADGQGDQPRCAREGEQHRGAARRRPRLPHHRRHHALAQPARGRVLPRGAARQPLHPRDVLPDGGTPRPPVDALPGRRRHRADHPADHGLPDPADALRRVHEEGRAAARRPVRLLLRGDARLRARRRAPRAPRLLGQPQRPGVLRLPLRPHEQTGARRCSSPRAWSSTATWSRTTWSTSTSACASCSGTRTTRTGPRPTARSSSTRDPLGNPVDRRHPWNQHTIPKPGKRDFNANYSWTMSPRWFDGTDHLALDTGGGPIARLWSTALSGLVDIGGYVKATGSSVQINLPRTALKPAVTLRVEDPAVEQRPRAQPGAHLLPGVLRRRWRCTSWRRRSRRSGPDTPTPGRSSRCLTRRSASGSPRRSAASSATTW